jgi:hypothetical protein
LRWIKPPTTSLLLATLVDLARGKSELIAENALLQQLIILSRQVKRPAYQKTDRLLLVLLVSIVRTWKQALFIIQPETLLRGPVLATWVIRSKNWPITALDGRYILVISSKWLQLRGLAFVVFTYL